MTDDIETLREFLTKCTDERNWLMSEPAMTAAKEAIAALERVEKAAADREKELCRRYAELYDEAVEWQDKHDSLRAQLDDAIAQLRSKDPNFTPVFDSYAAENQRFFDKAEAFRAQSERAKEALEPFAACADWVDNTGQGDDMTITVFGASITAKQARYARTVLAGLSAGAPAQQTQISDEAVKEALDVFLADQSGLCEAAMRAAITAAIEWRK